jgi:hypothetical protein
MMVFDADGNRTMTTTKNNVTKVKYLQAKLGNLLDQTQEDYHHGPHLHLFLVCALLRQLNAHAGQGEISKLSKQEQRLLALERLVIKGLDSNVFRVDSNLVFHSQLWINYSIIDHNKPQDTRNKW